MSATNEDGLIMYYVYILESLSEKDRFYIGFTQDIKRRLSEHNSGKSTHTNKYLPWTVRDYFAFNDKNRAERFESYLKTHSGRSFQKRHF